MKVISLQYLHLTKTYERRICFRWCIWVTGNSPPGRFLEPHSKNTLTEYFWWLWAIDIITLPKFGEGLWKNKKRLSSNHSWMTTLPECLGGVPWPLAPWSAETILNLHRGPVVASHAWILTTNAWAVFTVFSNCVLEKSRVFVSIWTQGLTWATPPAPNCFWRKIGVGEESGMENLEK
jgi:hypothetical protein